MAVKPEAIVGAGAFEGFATPPRLGARWTPATKVFGGGLGASLIAAGAVVALLLLAVVAALIPRRDTQIDTRAYLQSLVPQHGITQHRISTDAGGAFVLCGYSGRRRLIVSP